MKRATLLETPVTFHFSDHESYRNKWSRYAESSGGFSSSFIDYRPRPQVDFEATNQIDNLTSVSKRTDSNWSSRKERSFPRSHSPFFLEKQRKQQACELCFAINRVRSLLIYRRFSDKSACVFRSSVTWFSYTTCPPDRMQWRLWNFPRHSGNVLIPIGNFGQCVPFGVARMFNVSYIANSKVSIVSIYGLAGCRKMEYIDFSYRLW